MVETLEVIRAAKCSGNESGRIGKVVPLSVIIKK